VLLLAVVKECKGEGEPSITMRHPAVERPVVKRRATNSNRITCKLVLEMAAGILVLELITIKIPNDSG
jgi:hypothetical protein